MNYPTQKNATQLLEEVQEQIQVTRADKLKELLKSSVLLINERVRWVEARGVQIKQLEAIQKEMVASYDSRRFDNIGAEKFQQRLLEIKKLTVASTEV